MPLIHVIRESPPTLGRCSADTCRRHIEWVKTPAGKKMPVDAPLHVVRVTERLDGTFVTVIDTESVHWATCPEAKAFKRKERP